MGQGATPANERRYSNEQLMTVCSKSAALAKTMDRLGYDTLWFAEHHFQHEGYECIPNILMLGVHLAHVTQKLRIGCGFNICPMWHPLRLEEQFPGLETINVQSSMGTPESVMIEQLDRFAAEVMPAFAS